MEEQELELIRRYIAGEHYFSGVLLSGAAEALREVTGASLSPAEQDLLGKMLSPAWQALGEAAAAAAVAEGKAMSLEQAIDYALQAD